jgi:hypothetical protein
MKPEKSILEDFTEHLGSARERTFSNNPASARNSAYCTQAVAGEALFARLKANMTCFFSISL